jgi:hypothetical protein
LFGFQVNRHGWFCLPSDDCNACLAWAKALFYG